MVSFVAACFYCLMRLTCWISFAWLLYGSCNGAILRLGGKMSERSVPYSLGMFGTDKYISCCLEYCGTTVSRSLASFRHWLGGRCRILSFAGHLGNSLD